MREGIELPFGEMSGVGPGTGVLDGVPGPHPQGEGEVLGFFLVQVERRFVTASRFHHNWRSFQLNGMLPARRGSVDAYNVNEEQEHRRTTTTMPLRSKPSATR